MKNIIVKSLLSARRKIDPNRRKHCFELFGYDFIVDTDFNLWLIEVNTNPCLEESSELLKKYLRRMVEDMIRLTLDPIFPRTRARKAAPPKKTKTDSSPKKENGASAASGAKVRGPELENQEEGSMKKLDSIFEVEGEHEKEPEEFVREDECDERQAEEEEKVTATDDPYEEDRVRHGTPCGKTSEKSGRDSRGA